VAQTGTKMIKEINSEIDQNFTTLTDNVHSLDLSVDSFKAVIFQMVYAQSQILAEILVYKTYLTSLDDRTRIVNKNVIELLNRKPK
jgi:hypothetical protein